MKSRAIIALTAVGAVAGAVGYLAWGPPGDQGRLTRPAAEQVSESRAAAQDQGQTKQSLAEPPAVSEIQPPGCTIVTQYLPNGDGTVTEVFSCKPEKPKKRHPYESYSNAALESLAYSDARAASVLSIRLRYKDEEAAMSLALRAAALSGGDGLPILTYANAYPHPGFVNDVPVWKTVRTKFVLSAVTDMLGDNRHNLYYWEAVIREHSPEPEKEMQALHARARQIVEEMRQIQLDVTGSSTIGG